MVTDEERDYMYAEYAKDPRMKINLGIRRRLAPLLDNGRDEIELLTAILFSLPGSPVLYYGDEIAMGDNVYLGDRDGVRTPMQWTGDRNGGFSRADFAQLYLAAADGPRLRLPGRQRRGAAAHARPRCCAGCGASSRCARSIPSSASAATSRCARATRGSSPTSAATRTTSRSACTTSRARRRRSSSTSRAQQGRHPEEMFGRTRFPRIGELPYLLTLAPARLLLVPARPRADDEERRRCRSDLARASRPATRRAARGRARLPGSRRSAGSAPSRASVHEFRVLDASSLRAGEPGRSRSLIAEARFGTGRTSSTRLPIGVARRRGDGARATAVICTSRRRTSSTTR